MLMASKALTEQRRCERLQLKDGAIALLRSNTFSVVGEVKDISLSGLRLSYIDRGIEQHDLSSLNLLLKKDDFFLPDIKCEVVWDRVQENLSTHRLIIVVECGLQFDNLTPVQAVMLKSFLAVNSEKSDLSN